MRAKSRLFLGTANFGIPYGFASRGRQLSVSQSRDLLDRAIQLGYSGLDTAAAYGSSEKVIGEAQLPSDVVVHTKIHDVDAFDSSELVARVERARKALNREPEIVYFHTYELLESFSNRDIAQARERLVEMGFKTKFGLSLYDALEIKDILDRYPSLEAFQFPANLFTRDLFERAHLDELKSQGIHLAVRSLFLQGILGMSLDDLQSSVLKPSELNLLKELHLCCSEAGVSPVEASIKFFLSNAGVSVIVGAHDPSQLINLESHGADLIDFSDFPVAGPDVFDMREKRFEFDSN